MLNALLYLSRTRATDGFFPTLTHGFIGKFETCFRGRLVFWCFSSLVVVAVWMR